MTALRIVERNDSGEEKMYAFNISEISEIFELSENGSFRFMLRNGNMWSVDIRLHLNNKKWSEYNALDKSRIGRTVNAVRKELIDAVVDGAAYTLNTENYVHELDVISEYKEKLYATIYVEGKRAN